MNPVFENIKLSRKSMHFIFWIFWIFSFTYIKSIGYSGFVYWGWLIYYLLTLPIFITHTYLIAYWLIPKFLLKKRYFVFFVLVGTFLILFSIIELLLSNELIFGRLTSAVLPEPNYLSLKNVFISGVGNHYIIVLFLSVKLMKNWYYEENRKSEIKKETIESEMELLKNQLHPRFVLSTIDALEKVVTEEPEKTPDYIVRISSLMNNLLIDRDVAKLNMRRELNLIESYLDIQKHIKYHDLSIQVLRSGELDSIQIPALTFFPLLEQILLRYGNSASNQEINIFAQNECDKMKLTVSFTCDEKSINYLEGVIGKTKERLSLCYSSDLNYSCEFINDRAKLIFEIPVLE